MTLKCEKVVVTGGRKFTDLSRIESDLRALVPLGLRSVAHGGARGADQLVDRAWNVHQNRAVRCITHDNDAAIYEDDAGFRLARYLARWDSEGKSAGTRRNIRMLEAERPDLVLAYPDESSRGTWHCVREACDRGITTVVWAPFCEVYDFMGEDGIRPGIYVDGPNGHVIRIDDQRRESHGMASDGGWASLTLIEGDAVPHRSRFAICVFDREEQTEAIMAALGDAPAKR